MSAFLTAFGSGIAFALGAVVGVIVAAGSWAAINKERREEAKAAMAEQIRLLAERNRINERIAAAIEGKGAK